MFLVTNSFMNSVNTANPSALCPDLLRYEQLGEADSWRGRIVRTFFWLLRWWPASKNP